MLLNSAILGICVEQQADMLLLVYVNYKTQVISYVIRDELPTRGNLLDLLTALWGKNINIQHINGHYLI